MAALPVSLLLFPLLTILPFVCLGRAVSRRRGTDIGPAASVSVGALGDRPPAPPRGRAPAPRHARSRREARAAHAAPPRRAPRRRRLLRRRGARGDADARPQLRDALHEPDGPAGVPQGHRGHHLRALMATGGGRSARSAPSSCSAPGASSPSGRSARRRPPASSAPWRRRRRLCQRGR
ncbi:hypothetical protein PVAP13_4NG253922 [Panicum virgatum]|uniref:Uncharacterized protein n=1 Tax=Panicum virgatum TaxID=38727 RepID=A0A8T0THF3_PANVG|nr:hypothetical protein PVAP13_4NG253922 [Panicum virgatum]